MKNFLELPKNHRLYDGPYFFIIRDNFPVSPNHLLIISHRVSARDYFDLTIFERKDLDTVILKAKALIESFYENGESPDGYNIGMNCGEAAGQTVMHFHCHVIPRWEGDSKNPRGGVRCCVDGKADYLDKPPQTEKSAPNHITLDVKETTFVKNGGIGIVSIHAYSPTHTPYQIGIAGLLFGKNQIPYSQDMRFLMSVPEKAFVIDDYLPRTEKVRLIANGYGVLPENKWGLTGTYGNGAIYIYLPNLPSDIQSYILSVIKMRKG